MVNVNQWKKTAGEILSFILKEFCNLYGFSNLKREEKNDREKWFIGIISI